MSDRENATVYCVVCASKLRQSWWPQKSKEHEELHRLDHITAAEDRADRFFRGNEK